MKINLENCTATINPLLTVYYKNVLPDEVEGIRTTYYKVNPQKSIKLSTEEDIAVIYLFTEGSGRVECGNRRFNIGEVALFVPSVQGISIISADESPLCFLQLAMKLHKEDKEHFHKNSAKLPYFQTYTECKKYKEATKSPQTINRMLLPEDIVPRLCLGSVETFGPDQIAPHSHPMLEQFFFGLKGNHCKVKADNSETGFQENDLLHIPLGSEHGVVVDKGNHLHYVWIDIFGSQKDMIYIAENHHFEEEK